LETKLNFEKSKQFWCSANESIALSNNRLNFCATILKNLSIFLKLLLKDSCVKFISMVIRMRLDQNTKGYLNNSILTKTMIYNFYTSSNIFSSSNTSS